jgi:ubiquinone/menaquinone biosynthesis C-methylase UbiE
MSASFNAATVNASGQSVTDAAVAPPPTYDLSYRDKFWPGREYEDRADRLALRALLPPAGGARLLDLGAGFGRLADEFGAFASVTLADTSEELLEAARTRLAGDPRFEVVRADARALPFPAETFDVVVAVRLLLHVPQPATVFAEIDRVLRPGGYVILEIANRAHILAAVRYLARRQQWSPRGAAPIEYLPGHFAHQPSRVRRQLQDAGLEPDAGRAVSIFRSNWLKRHVSASVLAGIEARLQRPLAALDLSPSVYIRARKPVVRPAAASAPQT